MIRKDARFLKWVADRLVNVYGESENVDFVLKLRLLASANLEINDRVRVTKDCEVGDFAGKMNLKGFEGHIYEIHQDSDMPPKDVLFIKMDNGTPNAWFYREDVEPI